MYVLTCIHTFTYIQFIRLLEKKKAESEREKTKEAERTH